VHKQQIKASKSEFSSSSSSSSLLFMVVFDVVLVDASACDDASIRHYLHFH
jgi:hypothetical protein